MTDAGIAAWRNPQALTVVFPKVSDALKARWQLATQGEQSHLIVMPNVTRMQVDALVDDMIAERSHACDTGNTTNSPSA
jgi:histidine decarboxylase